ncbi:THUMP domain-containing class I SAM-dependent RNA methyltransferase [Phaeobacter marinintestinus]|uniref:THUMP domain-containing class I SAM-dependent RNA methyltransferase n=1 Tax=Falsiphaeobacter marinintestinus TaxID=1492905 RepID=UPI0011B7B5EB|nr:class I SAM-dependent RNA methyltransferase [Phaeobacter marinintestinus]
MSDPFEVFLMAPPGFETVLADEVREKGFADPKTVPGGVTMQGDWPDVWRANLQLRGAGRVLARFAEFRTMHLAQLDKRSRKLDWASILRKDVPVRVEATCRKSRIYHAKAAQQRVERAITEELGAPLASDAALTVRVRIEDDMCTLSLDTSGEPLHKRGHKAAVGKAPMRESMAAMFLRQCGYTGTEPVLDPMCGSGTFVIEAAEIAAGLYPGRTRRFAFEDLANFDRVAWDAMKAGNTLVQPANRFYGSDRDAGAIQSCIANADRAGVAEWTEFTHAAVSDLQRPEGPPGLVIVNPPYGTRIGNKKLLYAIYGAFGQTMKERFSGWRVGMITTEAGLAKTTGLPFTSGPPIPHGGLKVRLFQTPRLR